MNSMVNTRILPTDFKTFDNLLLFFISSQIASQIAFIATTKTDEI